MKLYVTPVELKTANAYIKWRWSLQLNERPDWGQEEQ